MNFTIKRFVNTVKSILTNPDGSDVDVQHPLPCDGDSVYAKDIDTTVSDNYSFDGAITDYFDSLTSIQSDSTANNPKQIKVWFKRTVYASAIGLGCNDVAKNFSNIKLKLIGSAGIEREAYDDSLNNSKLNSKLIVIEPTAFNGFVLEFHTTDEVCLSNITIRKEITSASRIRALKEDGTPVNIGATNNDNLRVSVNEYGDTPAIDAFARLRISEPFTIFDSKQLHDKQPLFWDEELGGSATSVHESVNANVIMSVTANASDYVIRQTKQRFNYQPGKSQLIFMTFQGDKVDGLTKRVGCFDGTGLNNLTPNNGIFFETNNELSWNICKDGTTTETITQENWNIDKLDGTGRSGITLDLNAAQIAIIDFEWLGVGRVRVGFVINGLIYYVHNFNHANNSIFPTVYMSTPNLPLRYSLETDGTTAGAFRHICSTIISEGGIEKTGILNTVETPSTITGLGTNTYAIIGIRLKNAYKDISVLPEFASLIATTNDDFFWSLQLNPGVDGTFTYTDLANSAVQYAIGAGITNTINTRGINVSGGGFSSKSTQSASAQLTTALRLGSKIDGTLDELVLCVRPLSSNTGISAALNFRELL